ncbi:MAG: hypothetical protein JWP97_4122 [Labilithrix sp.]|nr:hypothetical protein [Labilithrix sp.]
MKRTCHDLRIVEFSIQETHVHLIVEAGDERALSSGMRSFQTRVSRRLNHHVLRRKRGRVWGDRYFRTDLTSKRYARSALAYVLQNAHHHGLLRPGERDPLSSSRWSDRYIDGAKLPAETSPCAPASTFMLRVLWEQTWRGAISPAEIPKP